MIDMIRELRKESDLKNKDLDIYGKEMFVPTRDGKARVLVYQSSKEIAPVYFDIHGGGFVRGKPEDDDLFCQNVCNQLNINVMSIEYRLAPEYQFPHDKNDVYDIISYIVKNAKEYKVDTDRMIIGGHSAGGNISTVVTMMAKESQEFHFIAQVLDYPPVDLATLAKDKFYIDGAIPIEVATLYDNCYRKEDDARNPLCSPIYATNEQLQGLPDALIITCEIDSLRDEAEKYAKKLMSAGVEVQGKRFYGVAHGFSMKQNDEALSVQQYMIDYMKRKLYESDINL